MKIHSFVLILSTCLASAVQSQNLIQESINRLKSDPDLEHASISFIVTEAGSNKRIAELNPSTAMPTASTAKLFSTAGALELLGPDYRPQTRLYIFGDLKDGILTGDLVIRGGGDVTLGSRYFTEGGKQKAFYKTWCDTIKKLGIKEIKGKVIADGSEFGYHGVPDGWPWSDIGNYYGAGPSGICLYDNSIRFTFRTGPKPGSPAELIEMWPRIPDLKFTNNITADNVSGDNSYIYGAPYSYERFSSGSLPLNRASYEVRGSHPDPEWQLAYDLKQELISSGIPVEGVPTGFRTAQLRPFNYQINGKLLYTHYGKSIQDITTLTNMKSINLFAEGLICMIGHKLSGNGSTEKGIQLLTSHLNTKMSVHGLLLQDGSGLSRNNGISATHFSHLLNMMYQGPNFKNYLSTLPVAGRSGTIASLCKGGSGEGRIHAKSGSMSKTRSYAGYVMSKSGKTLIFSISVNNYTCSGSAVVRKIENVLNSIALY